MHAASAGAASDAVVPDAPPTLPDKTAPTTSAVKSEVDANPFREMGGSNEADFSDQIMLKTIGTIGRDSLSKNFSVT